MSLPEEAHDEISYKKRGARWCPAQLDRLSDTYDQDQPQLPVLQEPLLQPPPLPNGLEEVMPNPERGPASIYSTLMEPQLSKRPFSTRNLTVLFSKILSLSFGSSRANPREGPDQPPCIRATRRAESILFCSMYSLIFVTAKSVTLKSDMNSSLQSSFSSNLALLVEILLKKHVPTKTT
jgi:hypothetical protein